MEQQAFHYYGCTAFNWAVAPTREEVIAKLAKETGTQLIRRQVKSQGGVYCWTCKVSVPQDTTYDINFYKPVDVPCSESQECNIISAKGKTAPYNRDA